MVGAIFIYKAELYKLFPSFFGGFFSLVSRFSFGGFFRLAFSFFLSHSFSPPFVLAKTF